MRTKRSSVKRLGWNCLLICAIVLAAPVVASSQARTGSIHVQVKDQSGAPMVAFGKLHSLVTGMDRAFETDAQGMHIFDSLPFGRYRLEVAKDGFVTQSSVIDVLSDAPISRTITMIVGATSTQVDVIETTPLPGVDLALNEIPSAVQAATLDDINNSGALDLSDFLNRRLSGVHVNEVQDNPFQPDVNYRGYTASPLLGTPQGLSVYMDGVRLNQPFGDVVSWDLIPRIAISEITLMPGSNPVFGLNTLGGALAIQTKDGVGKSGGSLQLSGGSFGRGTAEFEHGGSTGKGLNWYLAGNMFFENGWRESSPSDVRQFYGKIGWQHSRTTLGLSVAYANNSLTGNGLQEQRLIPANYAGVYTKPDITANRSPFSNLSLRHSLSNTLTASGNVYYRFIRTNTLNGDLNENSLDQSIYQPSAADIRALTAAGYTGFPTSGATAANTPFPSWRCIAQALQRDEPGEKCNGLLNRTHSEQNNYGASGQMTWLGNLNGHRNQLTAGAAWDGSGVVFQQSSQLGYLNPDRSVTGVSAFGDGITGGSVDDVPFDTRVDLHGTIRTGSVYATDTLSLGNAWNLTLSGRYNRNTINNKDRITPGGGPGSLDSENAFSRFNPAFGLTFNPWSSLNAYFNYSEGSRAPTSIELGCADPNQPCKLPNALAGDPPLNQVTTKTWEAGLRGQQERTVNWSVGWFRAENRNDILFVASTQTGFGYFKNFGKTRRQGAEVDLSGKVWRLTLGGGYTFLDATYQSAETVDGSSNSTNDSALTGDSGFDGTMQIQAGDHIPLMPKHGLKTYAVFQATKKLSVDVGMVAASTSFARGNENNLHQPDGKYYLGPGISPGYGVANLGAQYQVHQRLQLFVQINNVLDHHYYTAAQLGPTGLTDQGTFIARPLPAVNGEFPIIHATFFAPGAPRGVWAGLRLKF
jgi:outer membrane receptor protein involved in Fe transport